MKKLTLFVALLCASVFAHAEVNFALASEGSSAAASSGNASLAIDGNSGTRWESAHSNDEWLLIDLGQSRTFNYIKIKWEGAYAKQFQLLASADGEEFTAFYTETNLDHADWQTLYFETPTTAQYIKYQGVERATQWGQSFYEFEVYYLSEAPKTYTLIENLSIVASSGGNNDVNRLIDGNAGTEWQGSETNGTVGDEASRTFDAWFVVDLGGFYSVDKVDVVFEGACAQDYHVDFSVDNTNWLLGYNYVGNPGVNGRTDELTELDNNGKVRYVRFWSTKAATEWGMKIFEFRVYGEEWVASGDTEAPVMVSAALDSKTWNSAVIAVSATDNTEVIKYHVVDATNGVDARIAPESGKITVKNLTAETSYNFTITAIDAANLESANNKVVSVTTDAHAVAPAAAATAPTWPADQVQAIYSPTYNADCGFGEWGSGTTVQNTEFGKKYTVGNGYFGIVDLALNCLLMEKLHFDFWVADDTSFRIVPIYGGEGLDTDDSHGKFVNLTGGQWNSIDLDLATDFAGLNLASIFQVKIDNAANGLVLWIGNAYFYREEALQDAEAPTNVQCSQASASYFSVVLAVSAEDNSGAVNYAVFDGNQKVATSGGASAATVNITIVNLIPNTEYNFSVVASDANDNAAEAVSVTAHTAVAPQAAPAPEFFDKLAVSVFCDQLDNAPAINIGGWGQSTIAMVGELAAGDHVYYGSNFNYLGWEFAPSVNATDMTYLHVDFYTTNISTISVTPISPGHEGVKVVSLTPNAWTSVDIALSEYATNNIEWNNIYQFKFFDATPAGGELFIDNVYFYKSTTSTVMDPTMSNISASKRIDNGTLYIILDGATYTVDGLRVR